MKHTPTLRLLPARSSFPQKNAFPGNGGPRRHFLPFKLGSPPLAAPSLRFHSPSPRSWASFTLPGLGEGAEAGAPSRPESRGPRARTCCCRSPRPLVLLSAGGGWSGRCTAGPAGGRGRGRTSGWARGPHHRGVGTRWRRRSPRARASRRRRGRARASGRSRSLPRRSLRSSHRRLNSGAAEAVAAGTRRAWGCSPPSSCRCCRRPRTASWISKR